MKDPRNTTTTTLEMIGMATLNKFPDVVTWDFADS